MAGPDPERVQWDGDAYHQVSDPQLGWGRAVLARLAPSLRGDERALDAGCGTGRLTAELAAHLPRGSVLALDRDASMLAVARRALPPAIPTVRADLLALPFHEAFDLIFSTATFHWVLDHDALFRELHGALAPGGRLVAQCGGAGNLMRTKILMVPAVAEPPFAEHFANWRPNWSFEDPVTTADRMRAAGFTEVTTALEPAPVTFADRDAYATFAAAVVFRGPLARLPDDELRARLVAKITDLAAAADPPLTMDYVRLNLEGSRTS
jgi:trans-aconitate 2-methyltransferase